MRLIRTARECLDAAIAICGPGMPYAEIGRVIQPLAEKNGCCIVKNYTGHGIGRVFHGPPSVYHYPTKKVRCIYAHSSFLWHYAARSCTYTQPNLY